MKRVTLKAKFGVQKGDPTRFRILAYTGGKLNVDGFDVPVVVRLSGLQATGNIPIACNHDLSDEMILGQTDLGSRGIQNDGRTLILSGPITADLSLSPVPRRMVNMARKGHDWQASIGADLEETIDIPEGKTITENGQSLTGPFVLAIRSVLRETSVLGMGADKHTRVLLAQAKGETMQSFEEWVASLGFDPATLTDAAKEFLMQQFNLSQQEVAAEGEDEDVEAEGEDEDLEAEGETDEDDVEAEGESDTEEDPAKKAEAGAKKPVVRAGGKKSKTKVQAKAKTIKAAGKRPVFVTATARIQADRKAYAAESRRVDRIQAVCGKDPALTRKAIVAGWSADKAELEFYKRRDRQNVPAGHHGNGGGSGMLQALQGAMILRAGGKLDLPAYGNVTARALNLPSWLRAGLNTEQRQRAMDASWEFRDMNMVDLCRAACRIDGKEPTERSHRGYIQAAVSGGSLGDIFNTSVNAVLIQKLEEAGDTTVGWTQERDANNFQPMDTTRLVKGNKLTPHARGGQADSAERAAINEQYKISRYSQIFTVDEQDMIDDAFQALKDIPDEMALACSRMRPDLVYSILLANAALQATGQSLFSETQPETQSNLKASSGSLDSTNLQVGIASMFNVRENGVGLNLYPTHLLLPMILTGTGYNLLEGQNIALAGTAGTVTERGDVNPLAAIQSKFGKIEIVSDQRLTNGVVDPVTGTVYSGSASTWRLASNKCKTIEVAYLKGSGRAPQVRQFNLDKGRYGIGWDVALDIGAKALEWRGMYESRQ